MASLKQVFGLFVLLGLSIVSLNARAECPEFLDQEYRKLHSSESVNLCSVYKEQPLLIINTASHCGFTPQFEGLEALNKKYKDQGLTLIGFASDDFNQEAKDEEEAATICYKNYGVSFLMLAPTQVKGKNANATFAYLNEQTEMPSWNFTKYLVSSDGTSVERFDTRIEPLDSSLETAVQKSLQ